jgi:hypothetical protein
MPAQPGCRMHQGHMPRTQGYVVGVLLTINGAMTDPRLLLLGAGMRAQRCTGTCMMLACL